MPETSPLPDLPLMLAGIPRPIVELLRATGIPAAPLPRVPLVAAGTGRFVLFNSRLASCERQVRQMERLGLTPIDFYELTDDFDWPAANDDVQRHAARQFLDRLKAALEHQGGAWARIAEYPFPWQSALCLAIEHPPEVTADLPFIQSALPGQATHFVSGRIRGDELQAIAEAAPAELGWFVTPEDFKATRRGTMSHWQTRLERFQSAGLSIGGFLVSQSGLPFPPQDALRTFGPIYACHAEISHAAWFEQSSSLPASECVHLESAPIPDEADLGEWIDEHYQAGCPLILRGSTIQAGLVSTVHQVLAEAARCTLLWQPSLAEFARWQRMRQEMQIQVWRHADGFEIHAEGNFSAAAWGIELWRGNHMATVPLPHNHLRVPDDGLIFLRAHKRHPAGSAVPNDAILEIGSPPLEQSLAA